MFLNAAVLLNFLLQIFFKYAFIYMTFSGKKKVAIPLNMKIYFRNGFFILERKKQNWQK